MSQVAIIDIASVNPQVPTSFTTDDGTAIPIANNLEILGTSVPAGSTPVETTGSGKTVTIEVQTSQAIAASNASNIGLAAFDSASFDVDENGYVTLIGGGAAIDSIGVQTGIDPVLPDINGLLTINGAVVAAGTNPVRSDGTGANTMAIEVQITQALAATDATKIGLANFDSAAFDVDANGFVQLNGGGIAATSFEVQANTVPGTDPVVPTATGLVTINGAAVANHSVVLETRSRSANAYNLEVQYATTSAASDATKSGVAHFNSDDFTVDANGFVSASGTGIAQTITGNTGAAQPPTAGNWDIVTANTTAEFSGASSTLTLDFDLNNLVIGTSAPLLNVGTANVGVGQSVFGALTNGSNNVAMGDLAVAALDTGSNNVAIGSDCLTNMTGSVQNVGVGATALVAMTTSTGSNTAIGYNSLGGITTGTRNIGLGVTSGTNLSGTDSSNIIIGSSGVIGDNNTIRLGSTGSGAGQQNNTYIAGINSVNVGSVASVVSISGDHLGTTTITAGAGTTVTPGVNTITIEVAGGGFTWSDISGAFSPLKSNGYFITGTATGTLPASPAQGDTIRFVVDHASQLLTIQATGSQIIRFGSIVSAAAGTAVSTQRGDSVTLVYRASNTCWFAVDFVGTWIIT